jgi:hypothetical protein
MRKGFILILVLLLAACNLPAEETITPEPPAPPVTSQPPVTPLPPVEGPEPSYKVAAFYYPWYGNPATDGEWIHWTDAGNPKDIASDYFPALGAYSSNDPAVVARHMVWLRQAGVGVIIVSWWGRGCREEKPVPLILQMAQRYGIKVAFHIEPYNGRTADGLLADVKYLYGRYGSDPAFFLSTATSRYSPGNQPKPMFFVWDSSERDTGNPVPEDYWLNAVDAIHALPQGGLIIADMKEGKWITGSHFDGLYNYATLHLEQEGGFAWAASMPPDSLYIPSVIPGFSAVRINYSPDTYVPRLDGATYAGQWTSALGTGVQPEMVTVTSFNEWHEGTMIEPPALGADNGLGYTYADFGALPPDGYLALTRQWVDTFLATAWPETYRARIQIITTSAWTTLNVVSGGTWLRPELVSTDAEPANAGMEAGDRFSLLQPLADAENGVQVQVTWDLLLGGMDPAGSLVLNIERGNIGETYVTIFNYLGDTPVAIKTYHSAGITGGRNSMQVTIPVSALITPAP